MSENKIVDFEDCSAWRFEECCAIDATAFLLKLAGGRLNYTTTLKLLYFADCEALAFYGYSITTGKFAAIEFGPIINEVFELITKPNQTWSLYFEKQGDDIFLINDPGRNNLSEVSEKLLEKYYEMNKNQVLENTNEWKNCWNSRSINDTVIPISIYNILKTRGVSEEMILAYEKELTQIRIVGG